MIIRFSSLLLSIVFLAIPARSQPCALGEAQAILEGADVRAKLFNNGALFWNGAGSLYTVPADGPNAIYTASLWLGGEIGGERRFAGSLYSGREFWPGPLAEDGGAPSSQSCATHDRIWSVTLADVAAYNASGEATADLAEWPAHLGAPVVDGDGDSTNYNLARGDRPNVYGGRVLWWIMNDLGGPPAWSGDPAPGVEVRVTASAVAPGIVEEFDANPNIADLLRYATHYRFEVLYRGEAPLENAHIGLFIDTDLGRFGDDATGTSPEHRMVYTYNGDDLDEGGYGETPPAIGFAASPAPEGVTTRGTRIYKAGPEALRRPGIEEVGTGAAFNLLQGLLKDGSGPWTFGGLGIDPDNAPTDWTFPAAPPAYWSHFNFDGAGTSLPPDDQLSLLSQGPYTLQSGETMTFEVAVPWARAVGSGGGALASANKLLALVAPLAPALPLSAPPDLATILPGDVRLIEPEPEPEGPVPPDVSRAARTVWPNPASGATALRLDLAETALVRLEVYDALGRLVAVPQDGPLASAEHRLPVATDGWAPGVYVYRLSVSPESGEAFRAGGQFVVVR